VHGEAIEEISRNGADVKGRAYFAALGWVSADAHFEAVQKDVVQKNIGLIGGEGRAKEIEMHLVEFSEV
jgi:hypothetical protein